MLSTSGRRALLRIAVAVTVASVAATGCSTHRHPPAARASAAPGASGTRYLFTYARTVRLDLVSIARVGNDHVEIVMRVSNLSHVPYQPHSDFGEHDSATRVSFVDPGHLKEYFPLLAPDGSCLCTRFSEFQADLQPGQSEELYAFLAAPASGVTRVDVIAPSFSPFPNVPIGAKSKIVIPNAVVTPPSPQPRHDPSNTRNKGPHILPLTARSDDLGGAGTTVQQPGQRQFRLASDVPLRR